MGYMKNKALERQRISQEPHNSAISATYDYKSVTGELVYQCVRYEPKKFKFRQPDKKGSWQWNLSGIEVVPYRLPEVIKSKIVVIVEGEKDADNVKERLGYTATTNPMGVGKWSKKFAPRFKGKKIIILPDNDEAGKKHAQQVASSLRLFAKEVKIVELPNLPDKGDVTDWLENGGNVKLFRRLVKSASPLVLATEVAGDSKEEQVPRTTPLETIGLDDFLAREPVRRELFVGPVFARGEIVVLSGPAKLGKSILTENLAVCLAAGIGWIGFQVPRPRKVLIIQQEIGEASLQERFQKMIRRAGIPRHEDWAERIEINSTRGALVDSPSGFNEIRNVLYRSKADILMLDPFVTFHTKKENSSEDMAAVFRQVQKLVDEFNIGVIIVHHFGKPSQNEREGGELHRGSSVIGSAPDANWTFKRISPRKFMLNCPANEFGELSFELRNSQAPDPLVLHRDAETLWFEQRDVAVYRKITPEVIRDVAQELGGRVTQKRVIEHLRQLGAERLIKEAIYEATRKGYIVPRRTRGRGNPKELVVPGHRNQESQ